MEQDEYFSLLGRLKQSNVGSHRAPHKPLLLLIALTNLQHGNKLPLSYVDIDKKLAPLLKDYAPHSFSRNQNTWDPFRRLPNDALWEILDERGSLIEKPLQFSRSELSKLNLRGSLPTAVVALLQSEPSLISRSVRFLLERNWPESLHDDIIHSLGLSLEDSAITSDQTTSLRKSIKRDPAFRANVLMAYERNCAVCGFDLRLGDANLGLEAAHIQWHAYEGPDNVDNGVALCTFHHKAFDRGAFKLESNADCYRIIVSQDISGNHAAKALLTDYHGSTLHQPQTPQDGPQRRYALWHAKEVFHGPGKPL